MVFRGDPATFTAEASGTGPLAYQWKKNGIDIPGATRKTHTIQAAVRSDHNSHFSVSVSDSTRGTVLSSDAILKVQGSFSLLGPMLTPRAFGASVVLKNGQVLILGGQNASGLVESVEVFNPTTNQFRATNSYAFRSSILTATLLPDGRVLIVVPPILSFSPSALLWDPDTETFSRTGNLNIPRSQHTATLLANGKVLVAGGYDGRFPPGEPLACAEIYDPATKAWTLTGSLSCVRLGHVASLLPSGKVLILGGNMNGPMVPGAEVYDPATGTFTPTANIPGPRQNHGLVPLSNGKVLAVGGVEDAKPALASQIYDPATNSFQNSGTMIQERNGFTAEVLGDGTVLAAGGYAGCTGYLGQSPFCELWNPGTGEWALGAPMKIPRWCHQGIRLLDGRVLLTGGYLLAPEQKVVTTAEIYE